MAAFAKLLSGGDRRSVGKADAVARSVRAAPKRFAELWDCLRHADGLVRMRAADAIEKLTRENPAPLAVYKSEVLSGRLDDGSKEMGWHLVALVARLDLTPREAKAVMADLDARLHTSGSRIVAVMALQAAHDLAARHPALKKQFQKMLEAAVISPAASLRARARKLSKRAPHP